jgi:hypothetical protein
VTRGGAAGPLGGAHARGGQKGEQGSGSGLLGGGHGGCGGAARAAVAGAGGGDLRPLNRGGSPVTSG